MATSGIVSGATSGASMGAVAGPWGAVIGGLAGAAGGILGLFDDSAEDAAQAMREAQLRMEARIDASADELADLAKDYSKTLDQLNANFDPFDIESSFASFYEGVILPMERDFQEFVLPSVTAAYSGGVYGAESYNSGAAKEAELRAKQRLSTEKGKLRAEDRERAIDINLQTQEQKLQSEDKKFEASTLSPSLRAATAGSIFGAEQATIETQYAAGRSEFESILNIPSAITAGVTAGRSIQGSLSREKSREKSASSPVRGNLIK